MTGTPEKHLGLKILLIVIAPCDEVLEAGNHMGFILISVSVLLICMST